MWIFLIAFSLLFLNSCNNPDNSSSSSQTGEYITRKHDEFHFIPLPPTPQASPEYPWTLPDGKQITKHHFRCKGHLCNPPHILEKGGEKQYFFDCEGAEQHSLPIRDGKEFIYPILITLLNYIQDRAQQPVIITSGHRCPEHNTYIDPTAKNYSSKHLMGAEVSFYVQNYEKQPKKIIEWIRDFYSQKGTDFSSFQTLDKSDLRTKPIFNKEILVKTYLSNEGRNKDNNHPFPYLSLQVRWDSTKNERINFASQPLYRK